MKNPHQKLHAFAAQITRHAPRKCLTIERWRKVRDANHLRVSARKYCATRIIRIIIPCVTLSVSLSVPLSTVTFREDRYDYANRVAFRGSSFARSSEGPRAIPVRSSSETRPRRNRLTIKKGSRRLISHATLIAIVRRLTSPRSAILAEFLSIFIAHG